MAFGLPLVGAQIVLLGASVFNRQAAAASAQLYRLGIASERLERTSSSLVGTLSGSDRAIRNIADATKAATIAVKEQDKAGRALEILQARDIAQKESIRKAAVAAATAENTRENAVRRLSAAIRGQEAATRALGNAQTAQASAQAAGTRFIKDFSAGRGAVPSTPATDQAQARIATATIAAQKATDALAQANNRARNSAITLQQAQAAQARIQQQLNTLTAAGADVAVTARLQERLAVAQQNVTKATNNLTNATIANRQALGTVQQANIAVQTAQAGYAAALQKISVEETVAFQKLVAQEAAATAVVEKTASAQIAAREKVLTAQNVAANATIRAASAQDTLTAAQAKGDVTSNKLAAALARVAAAATAAASAEVQLATASTIARITAMAAATLTLVAALGRIAVVVGVIAAALGIFASKAQRELQLIGDIAGITGKELIVVQKIVQQEALRTGKSFGDLAQGVGEYIKAGGEAVDVSKGNIAALINTFTVIAGGEVTAAEAGKALALNVNRFSTATTTAAERGAIAERILRGMTVAAQESALGIEGVNDAMNKAGGVFANFGLSIEESFALIGTIGKVIPVGTEVGTTLQRVFTQLQAPSKEAAELMHKYQISLFDVNKAARPVRDILIDLKNQTENLNDAAKAEVFVTLFGERGIRAAQALGRTGTEVFDSILEGIDKIDVAKIEMGQVNTAIGQLERLGQSLGRIGRDLGTIVEPALRDIIKAFADFLNVLSTDRIGEFFNRLGQAANVVAFTVPHIHLLRAALIGAGAAITVALLPSIINMARVLATTFIPMVAAATIRVLQFIASIALTMAPVLLLGAIVAAVALLIIENWDALGKTFSIIGQLIENVLNALGETFASWGNELQRIINAVWKSVSDNTNSALQTISGNTELTLNSILTGAAKWGNNLVSIFVQAWNGALQAVGSFIIEASKMLDAWILQVAQIPFLPGPAKELLAKLRIGNALLAGTVKSSAQVVAALVDGKPVLEAFTESLENLESVKSKAVDSLAKSIGDLTEGARKAGASTLAQIESLRAQLEAILTAPFPEIKLPELEEVPRGLFPDQEPGTEGFAPAPDGGGGGESPYDKALEKLAEFERDYNRELDELVRDTNEALRNIDTKFREDFADAVIKATAEILDIITQAQEDIDTARQEVFDRRAIQARRDALDEELRIEEAARQRRLEDEEIAHDKLLEEDEEFFEKRQNELEEAEEDRLEIIERARDIELEDLEIAHDKELDAIRRHNDELRNERQRAFDEQQDEEARQRQEAQDAADAAAQKQQERELNALREKHELQDRERSRAQEVEAAQGEFDTALIVPRRRVEEARTQLEKNAALIRLAFAERQAQKELDLKLKEIAEKHAADDEERAFQEKQENELAALRAKHDKADAERKRKQAADDLAFRKQQEEEARAFRAQLEAEERAEREAEDAAELVRKRAQDVADLEFRKQQEKELLEFRKGLELEATRREQTLEQTALERSRTLAEQDRLFQLEQDARRKELDIQLEDEALALKIENIEKKREADIENTNASLGEQLNLLRENAAKELHVVETNAADKLRGIREKLVDKLDDVLREAGEQIRPEIEKITVMIEDRMGRIESAAKDAAAAIAEAIGAQEALNTLRESSSNQGELFEAQHGGVVPGPRGKPQLIIAHGGEVFAGMHGEKDYLINRMLSGVHRAEVAPSAVVQGGSTVNDYDFNLNATYANTQSEASVAMDMRALLALSKR